MLRYQCSLNFSRRHACGEHAPSLFSQNVLADGRGLTGGYDYYDLATGRVLAVVRRKLFKRSAPDLLVELGELSRNGGLSIRAGSSREFRQCFRQSARSFVEHRGYRRGGDQLEFFRSVHTLSRKEAQECEAAGVKSARNESGQQRACTRNRNHLVSCIYYRRHQATTRVGQERGAGVRYQRDGLSVREPFENARGYRRLVVLMAGEHGGTKLVPLEELSRGPRILGEYQIRRAQRVEGAKGDVTEVADGGADNQQLAAGASGRVGHG